MIATRVPANSDISDLPRDLSHWVSGKRLRLCLTPHPDGRIHVHIAVPASALPTPGRYGVDVNHSYDGVLQYYAPGELVVDVDTNTLRGNRAGCQGYCPAYRIGFSLDLEPEMTADVATAVRRCNTLARLMASQEEA